MVASGMEPDGFTVRWEHALGLFLDLAKANTGYAVMMGDNLLHYGDRSFKRIDHDGELLAEFTEWIEELLETAEFDVIGVEEAFAQKGRANELWHNLMGALKLIAHRRGLPIAYVLPSQLKFYAAGHGNSTKAAVVKAVSKRFEGQIGGENGGEISEDAADAIGVSLACAGRERDGLRIKWR